MSTIFLDIAHKYSKTESDGENQCLFDFSFIKQNISIISQKLF